MSNHTASSPEITYTPEHTSGTKRIWKVFWILSAITVIEVTLGLFMYLTDMPSLAIVFLKGVVVIFGLAKAFYIVAYFMHLGDEFKAFVMTMVIPVLFLVWGIVALMIEGETSLDNKKKINVYYKEYTKKVEAQPDVKDLKPTKSEEHH